MTDNNVISFPRLGFTLTPPNTPPMPASPPPNAPSPAPAITTGTGRRSPLDTLAALPSPGITQPVIPAPAVPSGHVPATFRSEPGPDSDSAFGPRLGALSLAAVLAVAVAALRGGHTVASSWWERRQAKHAETAQLREARLKHQLAMQGIGDKAAQQRAKSNRIPSSAEYGRKTLGSRSGGSTTGKKTTGSNSASGKNNLSRTGTGGKSGTKSAGVKPAGRDRSKGNRLKPPTGGRSPKSAGTSPAMRRAQARQERKAARQAARLKTRDAAHARKNATKEATGAGKDKDRPGKKKTATAGGHTTLGDAIGKTARQRLKKRRKHLEPPIVSTIKKPKKKDDTTKGKDAGSADRLRKTRTRKDDTSKPKNATTGPRTKDAPKTGGTKHGTKTRSRWERLRDRAREKAATGGFFRGSTDSTEPPTGESARSRRDTTGAGPRGTRRSPFENAAHTTPTEWTVERADRPSPGHQPAALTTGTPALASAPTPHTQRPGTTRPNPPTPMPPATSARIQEARTMAAHVARTTVGGQQMDAQHATEITLDGALDALDGFTQDAFKTHDESGRLATKARSLKEACYALAEELETRHNLIGLLFTAALVRFMESMDLVDRMAQEMELSSLEAAEMAESASNELNDAYRPITQATADAGLATPSAPVHNRA